MMEIPGIEQDYFERLRSETSPMLGLFVAAALLLIYLGSLRVLLRKDPLTRKLRTPTRLAVAAMLLAGTSVFLKVHLGTIFKVPYYAALFVLTAAYVLAGAFTIADLFMGRKRHVETPKILRDISMVLVYAVAVFVVLGRHGVDLTSIVATSAVLTAVIGFALQDLLSNLISGLAIQLEKPFHIGDWVQFDRDVGRVVESNWRSTKMVTRARDVVVIPNNAVTRGAMVNYSQPARLHRLFIDVGLPYDTPPSAAEEALLASARGVEDVLDEPKPSVIMRSYGDSAIQYRLYFFTERFDIEDDVVSRVASRVWYCLRRAGITIPFPIRDVTVRQASPASDEEMQIASACRALGAIPLFEPVGQAERAELARHARSVHFGAGESVVTQGEAGDSFFLVRSGKLEVLLRDGSAPPKVIAELSRGDFFGEMSLLTGEPRSASVRAMTDCQMLLIDHESFSRVLLKDDRLADAIGRVLAMRREALDAARVTRAAGQPPEPPESLARRIRAFFRKERS